MSPSSTDRCARTAGVTLSSPHRRLRADAAPQEVADRGEERHAHERREEPSLHEPEPRQREHVEGRVAAEPGIGPRTRRPRSRATAGTSATARVTPMPTSSAMTPAPSGRSHFRCGSKFWRTRSTISSSGESSRGGGDSRLTISRFAYNSAKKMQTEDQPQQELRPDRGPEDRAVVDLTEPEEVHVELGHEGEEDRDQHQDADHDEWPASLTDSDMRTLDMRLGFSFRDRTARDAPRPSA